MCNHHVFEYPEDKRENYNPDGKTLTGVCKCGAKQKAYGMRWSILVEESFLQEIPYGETRFEFDKSRIIW
jgi:hypothetical protein